MAIFVPMKTCPTCEGRLLGFILKNGTRCELQSLLVEDSDRVIFKDKTGRRSVVAKAQISGNVLCDRCRGRKKVSLLNVWLRSREPLPE